jgi:ribose transport system permease protein
MKRFNIAEFAGPLAALVLIVVVVAVTTPSFWSADNFRNIALQVAVLSVVALGATIVIVTGGIDLSPGSMIAVLTMVLALTIKTLGQPLWLSVLVTVLLGALMGALNGALVSYLRIPAFIVTLAGMSAYKGLALTVPPGSPIFSLSPDLGNLFYGEVVGIPLPFFYVIGLYALATVVLNFTKFGREIYALGGNEVAARLSGVQVKWVRMLAYVAAGACTGIGGVLLAARLNSGSPNYGAGIELLAIAGAVVGGASLAGGRGHIVNTLVGVLIIVVVQNGLNLNAVSTSVQSVAIGAIILLAVALDIWRPVVAARLTPLLPTQKTLATRK